MLRSNPGELKGGYIGGYTPLSIGGKGEFGVGVSLGEVDGGVCGHIPGIKADGGYDEGEKFPGQNPK